MRLRDVADEIGMGPVGCFDGGCIWGGPGGMSTNGGCDCLKGDRHESRHELLKMTRVAQHLLKHAAK